MDRNPHSRHTVSCGLGERVLNCAQAHQFLCGSRRYVMEMLSDIRKPGCSKYLAAKSSVENVIRRDGLTSLPIDLPLVPSVVALLKRCPPCSWLFVQVRRPVGCFRSRDGFVRVQPTNRGCWARFVRRAPWQRLPARIRRRRARPDFVVPVSMPHWATRHCHYSSWMMHPSSPNGSWSPGADCG